MPHIDSLGDPTSYNHYCSGWAWAFDTPFPYWKRYSGYEGGTADLCLVSWPAGISARGEIREQYQHAVDVAPTLYEMLGVEPPEALNGYTQSPIEGESFAASFTDPAAPGRADQFYSMLGQRAMYLDGWLANTVHPTISGWGNFDHDVWELYHLAEDRAQQRNLADEYPEKLQELIERWWHDAGVYNGLPVDDRTAPELLGTPRPQPSEPRDRYVYYPGMEPVPESVAVNLRGRSFTIAAGVDVTDARSSGVLFSQGTLLGGHTMFLRNGQLHYVYNWLGEDIQTLVGDVPNSLGRHVYTAEFALQGRDDATPSPVGTVTLRVDDHQIAESTVRMQPGKFGLGSGFVVGRAIAPAPAPDLVAPSVFTGGEIEAVIVDVSGDPWESHESEVMAWLAHD